MPKIEVPTSRVLPHSSRVEQGKARSDSETSAREVVLRFTDGFEAGQSASSLLDAPPLTVVAPDEAIQAARLLAKEKMEAIFFEAVKNDDLEELQFAFINGLHDVNCKDRHGLSLLHHCKSVEMAKWLVKHGAEVSNSKNSFAWTPLHSASSAELVGYFVEQGLSVWDRDRSGNTPLCLASDRSVAQAIVEQAIIDPDALAHEELEAMHPNMLRTTYVNQVVGRYSSPLQEAVKRANLAFVEGRDCENENKLIVYLLSLKAEAGVFSEWGRTPLQSSIELNNMPLVDILLRGGASPNDFKQNHLPAIFSTDDPILAKKLIDHGAKIEESYATYESLKGMTFRTPLEIARSEGRHEVADVIERELVKRKLDKELGGEKWFFVK